MSSTYDWPFRRPFLPSQFEWGPETGNLTAESVINGGIQTSAAPGKKWAIGMVLPATAFLDRWAELEGWLDRLNGQENRVRLWHFERLGLTGRGTPRGNINPTGVQVKTTAAQFATSMVLKGCGAGKTLEAGDMYQVAFASGTQLLMNDILRSANGSGELTVPVNGGLRAPALADAVITLIRPTASFVLRDPNWKASYVPGQSASLGLDWREVYDA